jgi:hypothetical protein
MVRRPIKLSSLKKRIQQSQEFTAAERDYILDCIEAVGEIKPVPTPLLKWPWGKKIEEHND